MSVLIVCSLLSHNQVQLAIFRLPPALCSKSWVMLVIRKTEKEYYYNSYFHLSSFHSRGYATPTSSQVHILNFITLQSIYIQTSIYNPKAYIHLVRGPNSTVSSCFLTARSARVPPSWRDRIRLASVTTTRIISASQPICSEA